MNIIKVPSGEINNYDLLHSISKKSLTTIISTGASTLEEVRAAVNFIIHPQNNDSMSKKAIELKNRDLDNIAILHCTSEYPAPFQEINLNCIHTLAQTFPTTIGYSDHSSGIAVPLAAVAMGARIIEKHFTISKSLPGPDHSSSVEPEELTELVELIRKIELSLGSFDKVPSESEKRNLPVIRRSLVANRKIVEGEIFDQSNLTFKRPGTGIPASDYFKLLGRKAKKSYNPDDQNEEYI